MSYIYRGAKVSPDEEQPQPVSPRRLRLLLVDENSTARAVIGLMSSGTSSPLNRPPSWMALRAAAAYVRRRDGLALAKTDSLAIS